VAEKPPPAHIFEQVAMMAALMEAMRTVKLPLRPVLMETCERHHECGQGGQTPYERFREKVGLQV